MNKPCSKTDVDNISVGTKTNSPFSPLPARAFYARLPLLLIAAFIAVFGLQSSAQTYNMTNGTVSSCTGSFYPSAGQGANYVDNENMTWILCSSTPGLAVSVVFDDAASGMGAGDTLKVYDGNSNAANLLATYSSAAIMGGLVAATPCNATGCLTFELISDGDGATGTWEGTIACAPACQSIMNNLGSTVPAMDAESIIRVCPDDVVTFTADPIFPQNNCLYAQDATNCTYQWDFDGDGTEDATGQTVAPSFPLSMGYNVLLTITDQFGCRTHDILPTKVAVSGRPGFHGINFTDPICYNDTNVVSIDSITSFVFATSYGNEVAGQLALPDNVGQMYTTSVDLNAFIPNSTVNSIDDITEICFEIEHSYAGDLSLEIVCPNGQSMTIIENPNGSSNTYFGLPVDADAQATTMGTMMWYCVSPNPTLGTFSNESGGGYLYNFDSQDGSGVMDHGFFPPTYPPTPPITAPGNSTPYPYAHYTSFDPWTQLVGCPLNGQWSIQIVDNLGSDNGFTNGWFIDFDANLFADTLFQYTPVAVDSGWQTDPSIVQTTGTDTIWTHANVNGGTQTYTYTIVDDFGCTWDSTISYTVTPSTDPGCRVCFDPLIATQDIGCLGDSTGVIVMTAYDTLDLSPPPYVFTYYDQFGAQVAVSDSVDLKDTLSGIPAGTYQILFQDSNGCQRTLTTELFDPAELVAFETLNIQASCKDSCTATSQVNALGGRSPFTYLWSNTATTDSTAALCAGENWVIVTDTSGCYDSLFVTLTEPARITVPWFGDDTVCTSNSADLWVIPTGGNGGYNFAWNDGQLNDTITVQPLNDTEFIVSVTDSRGCVGDTAIPFTVMPPLILNLMPYDTICREDSITLTALAGGGDGDYLFEWGNGLGNTQSITVAPVADNMYNVTLSDGCNSPQLTANSIIYVGEYPVFWWSPISATTGCTPVEVRFKIDSINPANVYEWNFGLDEKEITTSTEIYHTFSEIGCTDVELTATSNMGCVTSVKDTCTVTTYPYPVADFELRPNQLTTINNITNVLDQSIGAAEWSWNFGDSTTSANQFDAHAYEDSGRYTVQLAIQNIYGCKDTAQQDIEVKYVSTIYIPNAFSPNDDGFNDEFQIYQNGIDVDDFDLKIFNRWGNLVWETNDLSATWDGTYLGQGTLLQGGIYPYRLSYQGVNKLEKIQMGHILIIR